jgi:hypothetical protein
MSIMRHMYLEHGTLEALAEHRVHHLHALLLGL